MEFQLDAHNSLAAALNITRTQSFNLSPAAAKLHYTPEQRTANHEASHALAMIQNGVAIPAIHFADADGTIVLSNGTVKYDAIACVEPVLARGPLDFLDEECVTLRCVFPWREWLRKRKCALGSPITG